VKAKVKSHYCTHIEQLKPKITFKRTKANTSKTLSKSQRKHRERPPNSELIHFSHHSLLSHCSLLSS